MGAQQLRLLAAQRTAFGDALEELEDKGAKEETSHWAWWAFPTESVGSRDPERTCVTRDTAPWLTQQDDGV